MKQAIFSRYTLYTALMASGMLLALYILLGIWPFGEYTVVTGDLGGLYINYASHLQRFFAGEAGFAYGFDKGLGGGLLGLFASYYASPLNVLYAFFPLRWFPVVAGAQFVIKIILSCVFFRVYIAAKYERMRWRSVLLALCYGFMAYSFAYAQNNMWLDVVALLPLVCLGIDRIIKGGRFTLYMCVLAVSIFANFYTSYMMCIFAVIYFVYSMLIIPRQQRPFWKPTSLRFAAGSLLGGGLCAALLVPALANINQNKGSLFGYEFLPGTNFPLRRLAERFVFGSFAQTDVQGIMPFVYCGIFVVVVLVCYFVSRTVPWQERLLGGGVIAIFVLSFWVYGIDIIWHGFEAPVWFPARYSFLLCFFLVALAARAMAIGAVGKREAVIAGGVLFVVLLAMTAFPIAVSRSRMLLTAAAVLFFSFGMLLAESANTPQNKRRVYALLTFIVALELTANAFYIQNQFEQYTLDSHQQFVDTAGATVQAIQQADDGVYRIAENRFHNLNDPMLLGYNGISHFGSVQDGAAQQILYNLGYRNYEGVGPYLYGNTAFADAVLNIRYLADSGDRPAAAHWSEAQDIDAPWQVAYNPYALPMAFTIEPYDGEYQQDASPFAFQNWFYQQLGGEGDILNAVSKAELYTDTGERVPLDSVVEPGGMYTMTADQSGYHYAWFKAETLLLPIVVNGEEQGLYFAPDNQGVVDLGWLQAGDTVTVSWLHSQPIEIDQAEFVCLDTQKMPELVAFANSGSGELNISDGLLEGSVTAEDGREVLYTSIAYDAGWTAVVNGEQVEPIRFAENLLAVPLQSGENIIQLRYQAPGSTTGIVITVVCVLVLVGLAAYPAAKKRWPALPGRVKAGGGGAEPEKDAQDKKEG